MDLFVKYNIYDQLLESQNDKMIPNICKKCIQDKNSKCIAHYNQLVENELVQCPYGFYSFQSKEDILTCLTPSGCRGVKDMKKNKENSSELVIIQKEKLLSILLDYYLLKEKNDWLNASIHDLKNITMYFQSMEFKVRQELDDEFLLNDNVISMLELYNLIKYRLSLIGNLPEQGYERQTIPIHSLLLKLIRILSYKAKNKKVGFKIDPIDIKIIGNEYLYLAFFTLIDNAVKYAPTKSEIVFYYKNRNDKLIVYVENIGPRLDEDEIEYITNRGYRGKNNGTTGNGVGLAVYKEICDKCHYDYRFQVRQLNPNQSLFTASIELPITKK